MPVTKVVVNTKCRYNAGSDSGGATFPTVSKMSNEHAATVPTARCFESPKTEYMSGGTKLESAQNNHNSTNNNKMLGIHIDGI